MTANDRYQELQASREHNLFDMIRSAPVMRCKAKFFSYDCELFLPTIYIGLTSIFYTLIFIALYEANLGSRYCCKIIYKANRSYICLWCYDCFVCQRFLQHENYTYYNMIFYKKHYISRAIWKRYRIYMHVASLQCSFASLSSVFYFCL